MSISGSSSIHDRGDPSDSGIDALSSIDGASTVASSSMLGSRSRQAVLSQLAYSPKNDIPSIDLSHIFGVHETSRGARVHFVDGTHLLYSVGRQMAIFNTDNRRMEMIPMPEQVRRISCIDLCKSAPRRETQPGAVSTNDERQAAGVCYIAVSVILNREDFTIMETEDETEVIVIKLSFANHSTRVRRICSFSGSQTYNSKYISLARRSPKNLICLGSDSDQTIFHFSTETGKLVDSISCGTESIVERVSINPKLHDTIVASGPKSLRVLKYAENRLQSMACRFERDSTQTITDHVWVSPERFLVSMSDSSMFIFENGVNVNYISPVFPDTSAILSLSVYSKGFIAAGESGSIAVFEKTNEKNRMYIPVRRAFCSDREHVRSMSVSPNEDTVAMFLDSRSISFFPLANIPIMQDDEPISCNCIAQSHSGRIFDIATCTQRPIIATASGDDCIRVWDSFSRVCLFTKRVPEEPLCLTLHPSGMFLAVGFSHIVSIFFVLKDDLQMLENIELKNIRAIRYSNGGHFFALASGTTVQVFDSYTLKCKATFKNHVGHVRSLSWDQSDLRLCSAGIDGAVYEWDVIRGTRIGDTDAVDKDFQYTSVQYSPTTNDIFVCGFSKNQSAIRQIRQSKLIREIRSFDSTFTKIALSSDGLILFAGNAEGRLLTFAINPSSGELQEDDSPIVSLPAHIGAVRSLSASSSANHLISGGDESMVLVWSYGGQKRDEASLERILSVTLVSRAELEEHAAMINELSSKLQQVMATADFEVNSERKKAERTVRETEERLQEFSRSSHESIQRLQQEKLEVINNLERQMAELRDTHRNNAESLQELYEEKIKILEFKIQRLQKEKDFLEIEKDNEIDETKKKHRDEIDKIQSLNATDREELDHQIDMLRNELERERLRYNTSIEQVEDEHEHMLLSLKTDHQMDVEKQKMADVHKRGELVFLRNKVTSSKQEIANLKKVVQQKEDDIALTRKQLRDRDAKMDVYIREMRQKDESIIAKESQINQLKRRNQELEKFRVVFGFKLQKLAKDLEPKERKIEEMNVQTREQESTINDLTESADKVEKQLMNKKSIIEGLNKQMKELQQRVGRKEKYILRFKSELAQCFDTLDEQSFKENVKALHVKYVGQEKMNLKRAEEDNRIREFERQREWLQRHTAQLETASRKAQEKGSTEQFKRLAENKLMVDEVNNLRRENHGLRNRISKLEGKLLELGVGSKPVEVSGYPESGRRENDGRPYSSVSVSSTSVFGGDRSRSSTAASMRPGSRIIHQAPLEHSRPQTSATSRNKGLPPAKQSSSPSSASAPILNRSAGTRPLSVQSAIDARRSGSQSFSPARIHQLLVQIDENNRIIEMQRIEIQTLRGQLTSLLQAVEEESSYCRDDSNAQMRHVSVPNTSSLSSSSVAPRSVESTLPPLSTGTSQRNRESRNHPSSVSFQNDVFASEEQERRSHRFPNPPHLDTVHRNTLEELNRALEEITPREIDRRNFGNRPGGSQEHILNEPSPGTITDGSFNLSPDSLVQSFGKDDVYEDFADDPDSMFEDLLLRDADDSGEE